MNRRLLSYITLFTLSIALLGGCSSGNDAVKEAGNTSNSFVRNSDITDGEIVEGGSQSTTSCSATGTSSTNYCLAVEANDAMIASWQRDLFNIITPTKAHAFFGLSTTTAKRIDIIQVDSDLKERSSSLIPSYSIGENAALGTYSINFASEPLSRIDLVARVTLDNDQVLFAPLITSERQIIVNVVSDYLVKQLFSELTTQAQLNQLLPCDADGSSGLVGNVDCVNQPYAKYTVWSGLYASSQGYEIDIPATDTIAQAYQLLDNTADFKEHIDTGISELTRTEEAFVGATERTPTIDLNPDDLSPSTDFNSALFEISFSQIAPDSAAQDASISTTISTVFNGQEAGDTPSYPELSITKIGAGVLNTNTTLTGDFPYSRTSLVQTAGNETEIKITPFNSLASPPKITFLSTQGFFLAGRIPFQTITDKENADTTAIGWQLDPYVHLLYSPYAEENRIDSLLSSYVSNGSNYIITSTGGATWDREIKLEEQNLFSWTLHNEATKDDFTTDITAGKKYGAIRLSLKLISPDSPLDEIFRASGSVMDWDISVARIDEQNDETYSFSRDGNQVLQVNTVNIDNASFFREYASINNITSGSSGQGSPSKGRLKIFAKDSTSDYSIASATPEGDIITMTLDEEIDGQGLIQALELRTGTDEPNLAGQIYRLEGNSFAANGENNVLTNYSQSVIQIIDGNSASLSLKRIISSHNTTNQQVSALTQLPDINNISGIYTVDIRGRVLFSFENVEGKTLTLKGFVSAAAEDEATDAPGNLMVLLLHDYNVLSPSNTEATLGLVHGFREQALPVWE